MNRRRRSILVFALAIGLSVHCSGGDPEADRQAPSTSATTEGPGYDSLKDEAAAIVEFLRGSAPLDDSLLADSVWLRVAPDGGGAARVVAMSALQDRSEWRVGEYDLVPSSSLTELTLQPGSHFNCLERSLGSTFPELDGLPHVGVRLRPPDAASCLQTWNATLVFREEEAGQPKLIGVAYDQWEW